MEERHAADYPHVDVSPAARHHGTQAVRGLQDVPRSSLSTGRFGRMFRRLPPFAPADADLEQLARTMIEKKEEDGEKPDPGDNAAIPAGLTYFGRFVDHDLTFDPNSKLQHDNNPHTLRNFRTSRFDLDSVFADGPADNPFLYAEDGSRLLIGNVHDNEDDVPRHSQGRALIGDSRNDENLIVFQI